MAQSNIRIPSIEELYSLYAQPKSTFDPSKITQAYATGMTLNDTIAQKTLDRQKAEEDLKKEIQMALDQQKQAQRVEEFRKSPSKQTAISAYPEVGAKPMLEPEKKNYAKIGETENEILLADMTDPSKIVRVPAPGVGKKAGAGDGKTLPSSLLGNVLKAKGVGDFVDNLGSITNKMSQSSGMGGALKATVLKGQEKAGGFFGGDPDVIAYEKSRPTMGRAVYKYFSGDVGNISENEGKFATDLLPSAYEDPGIRQSKLARLKDFKGKSNEAIAEVLAFAKTSGLGPKETEEAVKNATLQILQTAVSTPLSNYGQTPANEGSAAPTGNAGSWTPEKEARYQELKKRQGR